jgi:hypothetical protein
MMCTEFFYRTIFVWSWLLICAIVFSPRGDKRVFAPDPRQFNLFFHNFSLRRVEERKHEWHKSTTIYSYEYNAMVSFHPSAINAKQKFWQLSLFNKLSKPLCCQCISAKFETKFANICLKSVYRNSKRPSVDFLLQLSIFWLTVKCFVNIFYTNVFNASTAIQ